MNFNKSNIPYSETNSFSKLGIDYLANNISLKPFFDYNADSNGLKLAIEKRKNFPVNRKLLVDTLTNQYASLQISDKLKANIALLSNENTFTICTAHQPNIFTGHLYFIYKILHAIKLANELSEQMPSYNFVPVYYMGSEDADLDELGEVFINGTHYTWQTNQTGAVGRMKIDENFISLIETIAGQLLVNTFGNEIVQTIKACYTLGSTVEMATFQFVHLLFNKFGLVVLLPDNHLLKNEFTPIVKKELEHQFSQAAVNQTALEFPKTYKVQAAGRPINLFYLKDNLRERIEVSLNGFVVANTNLEFSQNELFIELELYPERFSPNVILRPVFQEMILPNIAFIGGGGELAYWLELKKVFEEAQAFFPALILRNSFTIVNKNAANIVSKLKLTDVDFFKDEQQLLNNITIAETKLQLDLTKEKEQFKLAYDQVKLVTNAVDSSLSGHVYALRMQALNKLDVLEKKILKAEKKKFEAQKRQIVKLKSIINPQNNLQERIDNVLDYLSNYGVEFIDMLYDHSNAYNESYTILTEQ